MGTALLKVKLMPISPQVNLDEIKENAKKVIEEKQGKNPKFETEPIAFGLNAIIITFAMDESIETNVFESSLKGVENVNSAEIIDFRRALG